MHDDFPCGLSSVSRYELSPNADHRPSGILVDLLVIHNISLPPGQFYGDDVIKLFCNELDFQAHPFYQNLQDLRVSSHLFIRRKGEIIQFVPLGMRAWHAGVSAFLNKTNCNDFSIGIELEGTDEIPYTELQYAQLCAVTKEIMAIYPNITLDRIVGHQTIAPNRKTDPGPAFNWKYFFELLGSDLSQASPLLLLPLEVEG